MMEHGIRPPGYRLPEDTRPGAVSLQIADLSRSIGYYESVLGLRVIERTDRSASLGPHGADRTLVRLHERAGARPVPRRGPLGLYHFAILLPDRPALGRFLGHLSGASVRVGSADHAVSEALYLSDPDGLGIEVYADRPRATWRYDGGQLYMTTEPLDVPGVIAAGRGEAWTGMPHDTVMGHVHLHVGDLDRGADFYHAGLGLDKVVWNYPGALFMSAGGYHHHLGTNTWSSGTPADDDQARLLSWDLVVPGSTDVAAAGRSLSDAGYQVTWNEGAASVPDPWGTVVRIVH